MIIDKGTAYETVITYTDSHRHKYGSAIAEYLDIKGDHDTFTGDSDAPMGHVSLFGKRIMFGNSQGFVSVDTYPSVELARAVFDAIDAWYGAWCDDGEDAGYDLEDDDERMSLLDDHDAHTAYSVRMATSGFTPMSFDDWSTITGDERQQAITASLRVAYFR